MDPKMIEMNNLRVLNDYLNQTLEVLTRSPRGAHTSPMGFSPFAPYASPIPAGTDVVWGQSPWGQGSWGQGPWGYSGTPGFGSLPFSPATTSPWGAFPQTGSTYDPFYAQRAFTQGYGTYGSWQQPFWGQGFPQGFPQGFSPIAEVQRQAQVNQALAAKHSVLEAICRAAGIPV